MAQEDFDLQSLAVYLHMEVSAVSRLAERGKIPARRVAGQWKFSQAEIHHWLEDRIGLSDETELLRMEQALTRGDPSRPAEEFSLEEMLPLEAIAVPLAARTKASVTRGMIDLATNTGWLWDPEKMASAVKQREELYPTAQDNGVALMHPRRPLGTILARPFLALGITDSPLPFGSEHGKMTDIFFLICSVDDPGHLRTLARLSRMLTSSDLVDELRQAPDARSARELIVSRDVPSGDFSP